MRQIRLIVFLLLLPGLVSCLKDPSAESSSEPDKALFDRATYTLEDNRSDVARITFQTLVNTYPDSKYAAMAKQMLEDDPGILGCSGSGDMQFFDRSISECEAWGTPR
jgi:hypothetical protein